MAATIPGAGITTPLTLTTNDNTDTLTLVSTDTDANYGPNIEMSRPVTGTTSDLLGRIDFSGQDAAGNTHNYFSLEGIIANATSGSEAGRILFRQEIGGATKNVLDLNGSEIVLNEDSVDLDFRVESNGHTGALFVSGEQDHHVAIGATAISAPTAGETLQIGDYGSVFKLDVNNGFYHGVNLYYDGDWKKQTANAYGSIIVQHSAASNAFNVWTVNNVSGSAGTNVTSNLTERFKMDAAGTLTATDTTIGAISDERLKENIQDYTYDVNKFKSFKPRTFDWKHPEAHDNQDTTGFVAQEIESVDSDWVYEDNWADDAYKAPKQEEEKALCNNEPKKAAKLSKKDAMYISVIQQLITRIEALESA
jgi:hypothetical protein